MKRITFFLLISIFINGYSQTPVADFEFHVDYKCGYATTEYINTSKNATTFLWDVGHGYFKEMYVPRGSNMNINKKWMVTLIAKGNGVSDTISKEVEVFNTKIEFNKTVTDSGLFAPLQVNFINQSKIRENEEVALHWAFGDGQFSEQGDPKHTYQTPGTYDVFLYGHKSDGCELNYWDYVVVKDTAQKGEFSYIISDCTTNPCPWDEPRIITSSGFILNKVFSKNGALILSGITGSNCCTLKTATLRQHNDTIVIKTWEYGPRCWCVDDYYFEIVLPPTDKNYVILSFNDEIVTTVITGVNTIRKNAEITIYPNPAKNFLNVSVSGMNYEKLNYEIFDMYGALKQTGMMNQKTGIIRLNKKKIHNGYYILRVKNDAEILLLNKIFID